ncbi:13618_t:CDS:2 [Entrophospora sp. SA101]|nr:13618_t:CDS:2 [Entrophospora sp. SA101]
MGCGEEEVINDTNTTTTGVRGGEKYDIVKVYVTIFKAFPKNAIRDAVTYTEHAKRNAITYLGIIGF